MNEKSNSMLINSYPAWASIKTTMKDYSEETKGASVNGEARAPRGASTVVVGGAHAFVLQVSRVVGLAPLSFERAANGWTVAISLPMCIYSYTLVTVLITMTLWGLTQELLAGTSVSVRMTSRMGQMVSICDELVVVLTAGVGVYGAPQRMRRILKFMDMLSAVDVSLGAAYSTKWERKACCGVVALLASLTGLLVDDCYLYATQAAKVNREWQTMTNYFGFYMLYYVVVILELQFAFTAAAVRRRFRALNHALALTASQPLVELCDGSLSQGSGPLDMFAIRAAPNGPGPGPTSGPGAGLHAAPSGPGRRTTHNVGVLVDSLRLCPDPAVIMTTNGMGRRCLAVPAAEAVRRLSALHGSLCAAVFVANRGYGLPLLIILLSTLLHLIVTPYFLILELISTTHRPHFLALQALWCAAHVLRLYVIVEPCHLTINEGRRTETLVCEMLGVSGGGGAGGSAILARLETFARQIALRSVTFTALGVCTLDRPLLAAVTGAVTTYLVILIQFQKSEI